MFSEHKNVIFSDYSLLDIFFSGRKVRIWCSYSVAIFPLGQNDPLQGCDVISRAEDRSFHGGHEEKSSWKKILRRWRPRRYKLRQQDWHAGNNYALFPEGRNFTAEVDSVCLNSQERFRSDKNLSTMFGAFR